MRNAPNGPLAVVQRYSWAAHPLWDAPVAVTRAPATYPTIAVYASGAFLVGWREDSSPPASTAGILARAFDSDGSALGRQTLLGVNDFGASPSVAAGSDGNYLVVWGPGSERSGFSARLVDSGGTHVQPLIEIETQTRVWDWPVVVRVGAGYLVVWTGAPEHPGVYGRLFGADGIPSGAELRIDAGGAGFAQKGFDGLAPLANGFLALWHVSGPESGHNSIYAQRFDLSGQRVGTTLAVNSGEPGNAAKLAAAGDAIGGFLAAGQEDRYPLLPAIVARRFTVCGDGLLRGEPCDDGNPVDGDGCDSNCTATACGNNVQSSGEECDDGNLTEGDGCSAACRVQATYTPTATPTPSVTPTPRSVFRITGCVPHAASSSSAPSTAR